jgi:hypothetical protein
MSEELLKITDHRLDEDHQETKGSDLPDQQPTKRQQTMLQQLTKISINQLISNN